MPFLQATRNKLASGRRRPYQGAELYSGAFRWMVPLGLALVTIMDFVLAICGAIIASNAETVDDFDDDTQALQAFFWCTIPVVFVFITVAECVLHYLRALRAIQIVVTASVSLFFCLGLVCMWLLRGFAGPLILPDALDNLPFILVCLAGLTSIFYINYLTLGSVALHREKKARRAPAWKVVDTNIPRGQANTDRVVAVPLEVGVASSSTEPPSYVEGRYADRRGSMDKGARVVDERSSGWEA